MDTEIVPQGADNADKDKIVVLETILPMCTGTVKWYSHKLLYGFISRSDNNDDVFVHRSAIANSNARSPNLRNGEEVEFSIVRTKNGIEAGNVTGPNGAPVQGFILVRRRRNRPRRGPQKGDEENAETDEKQADAAGDDRQQRRRPRRRNNPSQQNGEANGTQSEGEVYYDAGQNGASPNAGQQRRVNGQSGEFKPRGGARGGRGGRGYPRAYRGGGGGFRRGRGGAFRGGKAAGDSAAQQ